MSEKALNIQLSDHDCITVVTGFAGKTDIKDVVMILKVGNTRVLQPLQPDQARKLAFALLAAAKTLDMNLDEDGSEPVAAPH